MSSTQSNGSTSVITTFFIIFLSVFGVILFGGIVWRRMRHTRRQAERQIPLTANSSLLSPTLVHKPILWDICIEKREFNCTRWENVQPLSLSRSVGATYQHSSPTSIQADAANFWDHITATQGQSWRHLHGSEAVMQRAKVQFQTPISYDGHVSFLIVMPSPHKDHPYDSNGEFALGSKQIIFRHDNIP